MKNIFKILFIIFHSHLCFGQSYDSNKILLINRGWSSFVYNFGQIHEEDTSKFTVQFCNNGNDTLKIEDVLSENVSLTKGIFENSLQVTKFPSLVFPNDTFEVIFQINPIGCSGWTRKRVNFYFSKNGNSSKFLLDGIVIPKLAKNLVLYETFHDFGLLKRGSEINYNVKYLNAGTDTITILSPYTSDLKLFSKQVLLPGDSGYFFIKSQTCEIDSIWDYKISFTTNKTGNYNYTIVAKAIFNRIKPLLKFEEEALNGEFEVDSNEIFFKHEFVFENISDKDVRIVCAKTGDGGTMASAEKRDPIKPGEKSKIIMYFDVKTRNSFNKALVIKYCTDEKDISGCKYYPNIVIMTNIRTKRVKNILEIK